MQPKFELIRLFRTLTALCLCFFINQAWAKGIAPSTQIEDPYVDLRTGPGRGYPIFYVSERGDWVQVLIRKTDWFKVRTPRGVEGWVHKRQLKKTLNTQGERVAITDPSFDDFSSRFGEVGVMLGDYEGSTFVSAFVGKSLTENLSIELEAGLAIGDLSSGTIYNLSILNQPFPLWKVSPYLLLSAGRLEIDANSSLVQTEDSNHKTVGMGVGTKIHLSRQFMIRLEYKKGVILTSGNNNQEIEEWKAGLAVFF